MDGAQFRDGTVEVDPLKSEWLDVVIKQTLCFSAKQQTMTLNCHFGLRTFYAFSMFSVGHLCIGYTWSRIPISRKFGKILADFCLFIGRFSADFCQQNPREESEFGKLLDFFLPFFPFWQSFGKVLADVRIASEYLPDILHSFQKNWGKRNLFFGFWRWILGKNLPKNREKSADFPGIRNSASRVANALSVVGSPFP